MIILQRSLSLWPCWDRKFLILLAASTRVAAAFMERGFSEILRDSPSSSGKIWSWTSYTFENKHTSCLLTHFWPSSHITVYATIYYVYSILHINICTGEKSLSKFHRYSLLSLSSTQGQVIDKGTTNSTLLCLRPGNLIYNSHAPDRETPTSTLTDLNASRGRCMGMLWETSSDLGVTIAHVTVLAFVYCSTFWSPWCIKSTLKSSS